MDAKQRFILMMAIGLTIFLALQYIMPQPKQTKPAQQTTQQPSVPVRPASSAVQPAAASGGAAPAPTADFSPDRDYTVRVRVGSDAPGGNGYEAAFSSVGAAMSSYQLLGYYRVPGNHDPDNRVILLARMADGRDSLRLDSLTTGATPQEQRTLALWDYRFQLVEYPEGAVVEPAPGPDVKSGDKLVFRAVLGDWEITKVYTFPKKGAETLFSMDFDIECRNLATGNRILSYALSGPSGLVPDDESANFGIINFLSAFQPSSGSNTVQVERKALREVHDKPNMTIQDNRSMLAWVGAKNRFFTALVAATGASVSATDGSTLQLFAGDPRQIPSFRDIAESLKSQPTVNTPQGPQPVFEDVLLGMRMGSIPAGATHTASYKLYAGPAVDTLLEEADPRFHGVVSYTISYLDFISRWLVRALTFLDHYLGNYGLAIIVVTIIIKIILHPLNRKSFVSMNKMSKLAPMMKEIQKKYASDKVRMQQEMSRFYKENGVSMAGGCLPVFLQLPIFFALYGAFSQGFSMRHAAFIPGWIQDLSKPDSVYDLGWSIPLLGSSHISLLPILYLALQYLQMSLQPKPSDPQQAQQQKIMKFMPLMFVFIFYSMPAGLVLYFTVSALAGVLENWWMRNMLLPKLGLGPAPAEAAAGGATQAGAGAAVVPSDARKKKKRK